MEVQLLWDDFNLNDYQDTGNSLGKFGKVGLWKLKDTEKTKVIKEIAVKKISFETHERSVIDDSSTQNNVIYIIKEGSDYFWHSTKLI